MTSELTTVVTDTAMGAAGVSLSANGIRHATLFHRTVDAVRSELAAFGASNPEEGSRREEIESLLIDYAGGQGASLDDYPVDLESPTPFQRDVWMLLRKIPSGETRSYGWVTAAVGKPPSAARAVGAAVGANPIPLWLPCHRVVAADGSLHGFGGGLAMKRALLEIEGALPRALSPEFDELLTR
jgi:methylated-DNA-[protein]-cysteine S-methyltransferase